MTVFISLKDRATQLSWGYLDRALDFLDGKAWVEVGSDLKADPEKETFDWFLRGYLRTPPYASWLCSALESARLVGMTHRPIVTVRVPTD